MVKNPVLQHSLAQPRALAQILSEDVVQREVAPGASGGIARFSGSEWLREYGSAGVLAPCKKRPVSDATYYDLASLTKPLVAVTAAWLAQEGRWSLAEPLELYLPGLSGTPAGSASLVELMSHRAGLLPHIELFAPLRRGQPVNIADALRLAANSRRPECLGSAPASGFAPIYSDLGYMLLGYALEEHYGCRLDGLVQEMLSAGGLTELGSARQLCADPSFKSQVAPTEVVPYRGGLVEGLVHDDNAWALTGDGSSGHAGFFGTARAILSFGELVLDCLAGRKTLLNSQSLHLLLQRRAGGSLRAGFDGKSPMPGSSAGYLFSETSFGHLGFTGTSLWCDPASQTVAVLLTNRVHPTRDNPRLKAARPLVHDAYFARADALAAAPG